MTPNWGAHGTLCAFPHSCLPGLTGLTGSDGWIDTTLQARCLSQQGMFVPRPGLWQRVSVGYLAHKRPNCATCLSRQLASHQPYLFSQNKPHGQAQVISQRGSSMHSQGKRSKYLPKSNSQSKDIMIGKLSTCPEDRIVLHVCKYM